MFGGRGAGTLLLPLLELLPSSASARVYVGRQRHREVTACKCLLLRGERLCVTSVAPIGFIKEEFTTGLKRTRFFKVYSALSSDGSKTGMARTPSAQLSELFARRRALRLRVKNTTTKAKKLESTRKHFPPNAGF